MHTVLTSKRLRWRAKVTIHRAENTDEPAMLTAVFDGLVLASRQVPFVIPLHPRTRIRLKESGLGDAVLSKAGTILLTDPVGYLDMLMLEKHAAIIARACGTARGRTAAHSGERGHQVMCGGKKSDDPQDNGLGPQDHRRGMGLCVDRR
ncbi:MAG: UDP-N-acetylglucosamine 2-epimerase [Bacillota bacterium]|nr:UDP-N-acetylglucosamine 2-epimerase [Bacillota bacterium]